MRKLLISVALATATLAAVPAAAQGFHGGPDRHRFHGGPDRHWIGGPSRGQIHHLIRDLDRAENRIYRSAQRRVISRREAVSLRREANDIRYRLNVAARHGINGREFAQLRFRVDRLEQRIRVERRDRDRRPG